MLVANDADLARVLPDFLGAGAYALDTEFHREGFYYPRVAVLQLAVPGSVAVVDATTTDPNLLRPLFGGSGVAVAHAVEQDLEVLDRSCGGLPTLIFDTQIAAGFLGYNSASLQALVHEFLGLRMEKGPRMSDWFKRPLTTEQIAYAEADVAHLLELKAAIEARLESSGRLTWALDECERHRRLRPPDVDTVWWRLKGSRQLRGKSRGVAQELAAWRERSAMEADRPAKSILLDEAVVTLAERPPRSADELQRTRLFDPRRLSPPALQGLLDAAARGADLPPEKLRLPPSNELPSQLQPLASLIAAWVSQQSRDLSIDAALLATRADIEAFLKGAPNPRLGEGWRAELIGATVGEIVAGRAAVAYDGKGALVIRRPGDG
jgi:ribonuclease D